MAQFLKVNADLHPVFNFDSANYNNDAVTVEGYISGTTLTLVTSPSGTIVAGTAVAPKMLLGAGVAAGTAVTAGSGSTWTVSVSQTLGSASSPVKFAIRSFVTTGTPVQPQGPKLDFFTVTLTGTAPAFAAQILTVVQQLATIHMYEVYDVNTITLALYGTGAWTAADIDTALASAGIAAATVATGASFH